MELPTPPGDARRGAMAPTPEPPLPAAGAQAAAAAAAAVAAAAAAAAVAAQQQLQEAAVQQLQEQLSHVAATAEQPQEQQPPQEEQPPPEQQQQQPQQPPQQPQQPALQLEDEDERPARARSCFLRPCRRTRGGQLFPLPLTMLTPPYAGVARVRVRSGRRPHAASRARAAASPTCPLTLTPPD